MHLVVLNLVLILSQAVRSQFPKHVDLQKVGEVVFNNEIYNVLKPTSHVVTDYFKSFMLGQVRRHPNERVFIDDNGFRHYWSGFDNRDVSMRKTGIADKSINAMTNIATHNKVSTTVDISSTTLGNVTATASNKNKSENFTTKSVRRTPRRRKKKVTTEKRRETPDMGLREGESGKTIVKTSFFCPFFGVITMNSYID